MATTLLSKEVKTENIFFIDVPSKEGSAMKNVRVKYQHDPESEPDRFIVQSAKMRSPFGITNNQKWIKGDDKVKWDIQLSFQGEERNKKIQRFREAVEAIDERILKEGTDNAEEWIGDDEPDEKSMKKAYKSALKRFKPKKDRPDDKYADNFKISISWDHEKDQPRSNIEFYDENGAEVSWETVTPGCEVVALFEINGIWCSTGLGTFGPSVKLVQLQVFKPKRVKGFQIKYEADNDDSDEEDAESIDEENSVDAPDEPTEVLSDDEE